MKWKKSALYDSIIKFITSEKEFQHTKALKTVLEITQIFYPKSGKFDKSFANKRKNETVGYDIIPIMFFVNFPYQSTNLIPAVCGTLPDC